MDISPKYSFSQISNNSINYNNNLNENEQNLTKNHPLFFSYKIVSKYENDKNINDNLNSDNTEFYLFLCNIYHKTFEDFFALKRHILQVEFNQKQKCNYCGKFFKRVNK